MDADIKKNLSEDTSWWRALYMLMFAVFYNIAEVVLVAVAVFQLLVMLFTGKTNARLLKLGQGLSTYIYQVMRFLTFNSDYHPYPFGAWPKGEPVKETKQGDVKTKESNESKEGEGNN